MSILALSLLAATSVAEAKEKSVSDHTQSITVAPFKLIDPRVHIEYERSLSDQTGFTVGATFGKYNPLLLRVITSALDIDYSVTNIGANAAFNYHFKDFNKGWFLSGGLAFNNFNATLEGEDLGSSSNIELGPTIGYKIAANSGFTFAFDFGFGYRMELGGPEEGSEYESSGNGLAYLGTSSIGWSF